MFATVQLRHPGSHILFPVLVLVLLKMKVRKGNEYRTLRVEKGKYLPYIYKI